MTDQTIPADQVRRAQQWARDILDDVENGANVSAYARDAARTLIAMMPPPTLADMTDEERAACQWMQADVAYRSVRYVIANPLDDDDTVALISADGDICWVSPDRATPRPDLPRLTWPGDTSSPAPALPDGWRFAEHPDHGRVIVTNTTPDPSGHVYFVGTADDSTGCDRFFCDPARLTYLPQ